MDRLFLALLVAASSVAAAVAPNQLEYSIVKRGDAVEFSLMNRTQQPLRVHKIAFSDPAQSGHRLYLYDPETKQLQIGFSFHPLQPLQLSGADASEWSVLSPGQKLTRVFPAERVLDYFSPRTNHCYLLLVQYRELGVRSPVGSKPSNSVKICTGNF